MSPAERIAMQRKGAAELVTRARLYDQNAMGLLKEMATNAERGDPVAKSGLAQVKEYIASHPVDDEAAAAISPEAAQALGVLKDPRNAPPAVIKALSTLPSVGEKLDVVAACSILAVGSPLTGEQLSALADACGPWKETFCFGVEHAGDEKTLGEANRKVTPHGGAGYLCAGHCVGMARRIQEAASGNVAAIGREVAWEMGC